MHINNNRLARVSNNVRLLYVTVIVFTSITIRLVLTSYFILIAVQVKVMYDDEAC